MLEGESVIDWDFAWGRQEAFGLEMVLSCEWEKR
jgi:hypothetical protein